MQALLAKKKVTAKKVGKKTVKKISKKGELKKQLLALGIATVKDNFVSKKKIVEVLAKLDKSKALKKVKAYQLVLNPNAQVKEWKPYPLETAEQAKKYSKGTQWCISNPMHFDRYKKDGYKMTVYISPDNEKVCELVSPKGGKEYWKANDTKVDPKELGLPVVAKTIKVKAEENYVNLPEEKLKSYRGIFDKLEQDLKSSKDRDAWHRCEKEISALKDQLFGTDKIGK